MQKKYENKSKNNVSGISEPNVINIELVSVKLASHLTF